MIVFKNGFWARLDVCFNCSLEFTHWNYFLIAPRNLASSTLVFIFNVNLVKCRMCKITFSIWFCERLTFSESNCFRLKAANAYLFSIVVFGLAKTFTANFTCIKENLNHLFHSELRKNNLFRKKFCLQNCSMNVHQFWISYMGSPRLHQTLFAIRRRKNLSRCQWKTISENNLVLFSRK